MISTIRFSLSRNFRLMFKLPVQRLNLYAPKIQTVRKLQQQKNKKFKKKKIAQSKDLKKPPENKLKKKKTKLRESTRGKKFRREHGACVAITGDVIT